MRGPSATGCSRACGVNATSPRTWPRICRLLTLADVLGVPQQGRWLLFDWSTRLIGYQDPDYASSAEFDPAAGTSMARQALALRPLPGSDGRMPDPRTREGMPDLYAYAYLLAEDKRRRPGDDVMSILLARADDDGGRVSVGEFENIFLAVRGGRERDTAQRLARCLYRAARPRGRTGRSARRSRVAADRGRGDAALGDPGHDLPRDGNRRVRTRRAAHRRGRQGGRVVHLGQPRPSCLRRPRLLQHPPPPQPPPGVRSRPAFLPGRPPRPHPDSRAIRRRTGPHVLLLI